MSKVSKNALIALAAGGALLIGGALVLRNRSSKKSCCSGSHAFSTAAPGAEVKAESKRGGATEEKKVEDFVRFSSCHTFGVWLCWPLHNAYGSPYLAALCAGRVEVRPR